MIVRTVSQAVRPGNGWYFLLRSSTNRPYISKRIVPIQTDIYIHLEQKCKHNRIL